MPEKKIIYREKFSYRVEGFFPSDNDLGAYGFSVELDKDLADLALQTEIPNTAYKNLIKMAESTIKKVQLAKPLEKVRPPYHFVANNSGKLTCLLQFCTVPGDACDLGIDGMEMGRFVESGKIDRNIHYHPHNVDNLRQAYALLSIWLNWADIIEAFLSR
jgi:hypothetical protein